MEALYDRMQEACFHILIFSRNDALREKTNLLIAELNSLYGVLFKPVYIYYSSENKNAFEKLDVKGFLLCIVRPDNYAGYTSNEFNPEAIKDYLRNRIHLQSS